MALALEENCIPAAQLDPSNEAASWDSVPFPTPSPSPPPETPSFASTTSKASGLRLPGHVSAPSPSASSTPSAAPSNPPNAVPASSSSPSASANHPMPMDVNEDGIPPSSMKEVAEAQLTGGKGEKGKKRERGVESEAEDHVSKKRCTGGIIPASAAATPSSSDIAVPPNAPAYFAKGVALLRSPDLGPEWAVLVRNWARFEALEGFKATSNLSATDRPVAVKDWIQRARSPAWRPVIVNTEGYGIQFSKWWTSLQPEWRLSEDGAVLLQTDEAEWECIRKAGPNGLLSVMAALFFWGSAVQGKRGRDAQWLQAVGEVSWVFSRLIITH